jgi:hypothetical protein
MHRQEEKKKTRRRMNKAQSTLVCEVFAENEGEWDMIMADRRVRRLGYSREYLSTHIGNKKKKIRKLVRQGDLEKPEKRARLEEGDEREPMMVVIKKPKLTRQLSDATMYLMDVTTPSVKEVPEPPPQEMVEEDRVERVGREVVTLRTGLSEMRLEMENFVASIPCIEETQDQLILLLGQVSQRVL